MSISGLNAERYFTIKPFNSDDLDGVLDDEYLSGKPEYVKELLTNYFNLQIIIY
jgi:hypothetical protein